MLPMFHHNFQIRNCGGGSLPRILQKERPIQKRDFHRSHGHHLLLDRIKHGHQRKSRCGMFSDLCPRLANLVIMINDDDDLSCWQRIGQPSPSSAHPDVCLCACVVVHMGLCVCLVSAFCEFVCVCVMYLLCPTLRDCCSLFDLLTLMSRDSKSRLKPNIPVKYKLHSWNQDLMNVKFC